jgi:spore coat polysaccharide biosynthesis protein SpsF
MVVSVGKRVGAIIPYRMAASRLPGKPLADVSGKAALDRVVDRARACKYVTQVGIATTVEPSDDPLVEFARSRGLLVYRGSVQDVLRRFAEAARAFDFELVVECDGDDLLVSTEYMDRGVEQALERGSDLLAFAGLPIGATPNIVLRAALERAVAEKSIDDTATGFFRYLEQSGRYQVDKPEVTDAAHRHGTVRMTLDYPEDLAFFRAVYSELDQRPGWSFTDLVALLHARPDLVAINQGLDAAYKAHFQAGISR